MKIIIINGPNLNLLGKREPEIYGSRTFNDILTDLKSEFKGVNLEYFQSNHEGDLIDKIHEVGFTYDGIILNGGAYTHTSIAIADAITAIKTPVTEVHISNIHAREEFRHHSHFSAHCDGVIVGCGVNGYRLAMIHILSR